MIWLLILLGLAQLVTLMIVIKIGQGLQSVQRKVTESPIGKLLSTIG